MIGLLAFQNHVPISTPWLWLIPGIVGLGALVDVALSVLKLRGWMKTLHPFVPVLVAGLSISISFVLSSLALSKFRGSGGRAILQQDLFNWIDVPGCHVSMVFQMDALCVVFMTIGSLIGLLVCFYLFRSCTEIHNVNLFFIGFQLFMFFLYLIFMASNIWMTLLGWAGLTICYPFMGFKDSGKQERIFLPALEHVLFLWGMVWLVSKTGVYDWSQLNYEKKSLDLWNAIGIILCFVAAVGLRLRTSSFSNEFKNPSLVILMAGFFQTLGPMLSGIYLMARFHFLLSGCPWVTFGMEMVGLSMALWGGFQASRQNDVQTFLRYLFHAQFGSCLTLLAIGAYTTAIFQTTAYAFLETSFRMSLGTVLYSLHSHKNLYRMGGALKLAPVSSTSLLIVLVAWMGMPPFSFFFSMERCLWRVWDTPNIFWGIFPEVAGFLMLLAFFFFSSSILRTMLLVLFGDHRGHVQKSEIIHELPWETLTIVFLTVGISILYGWVDISKAIGGADRLENFLGPVFEGSESRPGLFLDKFEPFCALILILLIGLVIGLALYSRWIPFVSKSKTRSTRKKNGLLMNLDLWKYWSLNIYRKFRSKNKSLFKSRKSVSIYPNEERHPKAQILLLVIFCLAGFAILLGLSFGAHAGMGR